MTLKKVLSVIACVIVALLLLLTLAHFSLSYWITPSDTVKKAIRSTDISTDNYVICRPARTTGYWWVVEESNISTIPNSSFFNIVGFPNENLSLKDDVLEWGQNEFVFYVEDSQYVYDTDLQEDVLTLTVSDWDILYPVGRDLDLFSPRWYLTKNDYLKSN